MIMSGVYWRTKGEIFGLEHSRDVSKYNGKVLTHFHQKKKAYLTMMYSYHGR
jgi:hypothetical protein